MKLVRIAVVFAFVFAAVAAKSPAPGSTYAPQVAVGMARGEPRITTGPDGALYAAAAQPLGRDTVFKSTDGGATWRSLLGTNLPFGGGDDDVMVTPDNTVWLSGQEPGEECESVAKGPGGGETVFVTQPLACGTSTVADADRPWLAYTNNGARILLYFNQGGTHVVNASDDGGVTWNRLGSFAGRFPGYLVVDDSAHLIYAATTLRANGIERVVVYTSGDGGASWTPHFIATLTTGDKGLNHVYLAKDTGGNLYTAWTDDPDGTGMRVYFSRSLDHATTWSTPLLVSGSSGTHIFPAIDAGSTGRVVVAWYESDVVGDPNAMPATAAWHTEAASSLDGGATWALSQVSTTNHHGNLCTKGGSCSNGRILLDFISVKIDTAGRANVIWADDNVTGPDLIFGPVVDYVAHSDAAQGRGIHDIEPAD
jgi:hypothetical protein